MHACVRACVHACVCVRVCAYGRASECDCVCIMTTLSETKYENAYTRLGEQLHLATRDATVGGSGQGHPAERDVG